MRAALLTSAKTNFEPPLTFYPKSSFGYSLAVDELPAGKPGDAREKAPAPGGLNAWPWLVWAAVIVMLYVLGIGPAALVHRKTPAARRAIEAAYKPVTVVADHCPPARACLEWYVSVIWRVN